jgi:hypothetical protein
MLLLTGMYLTNGVDLDRLKTKNFSLKGKKFRSADLLSYKFDNVISKEKEELFVHNAFSEVQKMFDNTYLLGKIAAKLNFYIRTVVQNLNDNHEHDDISDFDESKESVNKFFYRNLINLLKEYYIASNSKDGVDLGKLFKRHIGKIEKLMNKEEFNVFFNDLLKDIESNYKVEVANSGMFIEQSLV